MSNFRGASALVVLSGGQDSTTSLYWAKKYYHYVEAITFNYGQRHAVEIEAAATIAAMAKVPQEIVYLGDHLLQGASPLTDLSQRLETYSDFATMEKIIGTRTELTFVPMRNPLFLTIAANRAAVKGINSLVTGVCQADNANYHDCTFDFIESMEAMVSEALGKRMAIETPLMDMPKANSVKLALTFPGCYRALGYSHTAYDGNYPPTGKDHASVLRAHGFEEAGIPDPLVVRAYWEGLMDLPKTQNYQIPAIHEVMNNLDGGGSAAILLHSLEERLSVR